MPGLGKKADILPLAARFWCVLYKDGEGIFPGQYEQCQATGQTGSVGGVDAV